MKESRSMQDMPQVSAALILNGDAAAVESTAGQIRSFWPWVRVLDKGVHGANPEDYLMLIESGDFVLRYKVKTQIGFMEENQDVDITVSDAYVSNTWGHVFEYWRCTPDHGPGFSWSQVPLSPVVIRTSNCCGLVRGLLELCWPATRETVIRCLQQNLPSSIKVKPFPLATVKVTERSGWEWLIAKSSENERSVRDHFLQAEDLLRQGDHSRALFHYERVTEAVPAIVQNRRFWSLHPTAGRSYLMRALCHHVLGQHRKAISLATFFVSMDGPSKEALQMIAKSMDQVGWRRASDSLRVTELFRNAPNKELPSSSGCSFSLKEIPL
jgi:hypothetical protein